MGGSAVVWLRFFFIGPITTEEEEEEVICLLNCYKI